MCGIAGLIDASGKYRNSEVVRRMADTMIKRGPDGYGEFVESPIAMVMRRLSIIDLEHGWQPFFRTAKFTISRNCKRRWSIKAINLNRNQIRKSSLTVFLSGELRGC